ncbi:HpcH/HpaI aldolase/citrate lyase family protein [Pelagibacterium halotolerans]|uniref:Citrate lyase beta chain n=1 Tax=Pelagibacterium halotolerans (strain DSM 22347 / JCM 15775 / CGMCC 1.7692 / B2) TaxID=1082931 RepID=G4R752_PELHB|nr:CoA ester lyase [Pelagibacterium halotolerans]AEQ50206.1 Citrate lyase beta chain [Pelagibacterium halotolerans B2]QJR19793.1 CoA ester lyase [Pelagibacterium halotolerans]SEA50625.1 citrate lyase subunit beta / citryl-CoA lyase [Pelagibacterium halotolerans]
MRLRSLLYVPADNERFIAKAHERGADAIILDLEDSVRPQYRDAARETLGASIQSTRRNGAKVFVRINTESAIQDATAAAGADGLYVSKASLARIGALATKFPNLPLFALIEDPLALLDVATIAAHPAVIGLAAGGEDLATALGAVPDPDVLRTPKLLIHYAAKAHGKPSLGLFRSIADYTDLSAIEDAAQDARRHGFDGASCVHPSAVPILNAVFTPTSKEIDWAQRVLAAAQETKAGAFTIDGRMIDAPVIARARSILS